MPQDSRSPEVLPNCLVQFPITTHTPTQVPMVFINSTDDPIVPPPLLEIVRDAALNNPNMIFIEQVKITLGQHERMMRNWCIF